MGARARGTARSAARALGVTAALLVAAVRPASAQELALKRNATRPQATACPVAPLPRQPGTTQRDEARRLAGAAQEAAIAGNQREAREQFARAARIDPTNEDIAYQYGRTLEDTGSPADALREYCRYITLAPTSGDAADVRGRIAILAPPTPALRGADQAVAPFREGVAGYERGRYDEAELAFGRAINEAAGWPEAYYNRAIARLAQRKSAPAVTDLQRYLELKPDASDRVTVLNEITRIQRPLPYTPGSALGGGIVLPSFGQFYTRRPLFGVGVLAATAGAVAYALPIERTVRQDSAYVRLVNGDSVLQPFGQPELVTERPNLTTGLAVAAGITAVAAVESYLYARRARAKVLTGAVRRTAVRVRPVPARDLAATGIALDVRVALPGGRRR